MRNSMRSGPQTPGGTAGFSLGRGFIAGLYYAPALETVDTTGTLANEVEYAVRFEVGQTTTFDRIGIEITTGVASGVVRLGIRSDTGRTYPGALVLDAGTIDGSSNGFKTITIAQILTPGRYWLCSAGQVASPMVVRSRTLDPFVGQNVTSSVNFGSYTQTGITGAFSTFSATATPATVSPKVMLRAA